MWGRILEPLYNIFFSYSRLTFQGQSKACDLTNLLMLHSIATAFKSYLRPSDMSCHDKSPADSLAGKKSDLKASVNNFILYYIILAVMTETQTDVDKVLMHLEAKEFTVEPSTLQSLQQLIQWVADLALSLLVRLPNASTGSAGKSNHVSFYNLPLSTLKDSLI